MKSVTYGVNLKSLEDRNLKSLKKCYPLKMMSTPTVDIWGSLKSVQTRNTPDWSSDKPLEKV